MASPPQFEGKISVCTSTSRLLFTRNQLINTLLPKEDTVFSAAKLLFGVCQKMRLSIPVYSTAMFYFQRFLILNPYVIEQVQNSNITSIYTTESVSAGCLLTAILNSDQHKDPEIVVKEFSGVLDMANVISIEGEVIDTNGYDFRIGSAHQWVIKLAKTLRMPKEAAELGFKIATDSYSTSAVLQFPAHAVGCACLDIAARQFNRKVPRPFLNEFRLGVVPVRTSTRLLLEFYTTCKEPFANVDAKDIIYMAWLEGLRKNIPNRASGQMLRTRNANISKRGISRFRFEA